MRPPSKVLLEVDPSQEQSLVCILISIVMHIHFGDSSGGQSWNDSYGEWTLLETLNIDIEYKNAVWGMILFISILIMSKTLFYSNRISTGG